MIILLLLAHGAGLASIPTLPPSLCCRQVKPAIYVTYNGDFFDWPFMGGC